MVIKTMENPRRGLGMANASLDHQIKNDDMVEVFRKLFPSLDKNVRWCISMKAKDEEDSEREKIPDIIFFRKVEERNGVVYPSVERVVIELDNDDSVYHTKEKIKFLFANFPSLEEFFIFYYESDHYYYAKYTRSHYPTSLRCSYSEVLGLDLFKLVDANRNNIGEIDDLEKIILMKLGSVMIDQIRHIKQKFPIMGDKNVFEYKPRMTYFNHPGSWEEPLLTMEIVDDDTELLTCETIRRYQLCNPSIRETWVYHQTMKRWYLCEGGELMTETYSEVWKLDMRELLK